MSSRINRGLYLFIWFALFLTVFPMASSVSVSPGMIIIPFEPNGVYEGTAVFSTGGRTNHLGISAGSTRNDFEIIVDKDELYCDREPCRVNYKVIMPDSFDRPGRHKGRITAREIFDEGQGSGINVVVHMSLVIYVEVPYPGKYLAFSTFKAGNVEAGETVPFEAVFVSKGYETINSVKGRINVYDRNDNLIGIRDTNKVTNVKTNENVVLEALWDSGIYERGRYYAVLHVDYDGLKINHTTKFKLGGLDVELINYTKEIVIGGIKPFNLQVESMWSEHISNLRASVSVLDEEAKELTSFETLTKNLGAWNIVVLQGYMDTQALELGDYNLNIMLYFANLTKPYDGVISIVEEPSEAAEGRGWIKGIFTIKTALIVLVALLIALLVFLVYLLIPKSKKYKKGGDKKQNMSR